MIPVQTAFTLFFSNFLLSLPFLLLGVIVSSFLLVFVNEHQLAATFPRHRVLGAIVGSFLGLLFPVAQYGNIPVTRRLLIHGVPFSVAISFLVASATLNPFTIWLSWQVFPDHPTLTVYRLILTWIMAVSLGILFSFYPLKSFPPSSLSLLHHIGNLNAEYPVTASLQVFITNIGREFLAFGSWLLIGSALAAIAQTLLPQSQLLASDHPALQILILMGLGFAFAIGSPFNITFLLPLTPKILPGSLLAFLLFSSFIDIKQLLLMIAAFRPKVIIYLLILIFQLTFFCGLAINFYGN